MEYFPAIASLAFIWFLVVMIPGPNFLVVTQASLANSRAFGIWRAFGVSVGAGTWASVSLLGLSALFSHAGWLYESLKIIGGCYLIYLGLNALRLALFNHSDTLSKSGNSNETRLSGFWTGLLTSFSNPKTAAFFGSLFLSTFPGQAPPWVHVATVAIVMVVSIFWYGLVACCFSYSEIQRFYRKGQRWVEGSAGILLSVLGGRLILQKN